MMVMVMVMMNWYVEPKWKLFQLAAGPLTMALHKGYNRICCLGWQIFLKDSATPLVGFCGSPVWEPVVSFFPTVATRCFWEAYMRDE